MSEGPLKRRVSSAAVRSLVLAGWVFSSILAFQGRASGQMPHEPVGARSVREPAEGRIANAKTTLDDPIRLRVASLDGVLVVYDAPVEGAAVPGTRSSLAFWRDALSGRVFVYAVRLPDRKTWFGRSAVLKVNSVRTALLC